MVVSLDFILTLSIVLIVIHNWKSIKEFAIDRINRINIFGVSFKEFRVRLWQGIVITYGLWLGFNFWHYVIYPNANEALTPQTLVEIFLKPPFIQIVLVATFFWLLFSLAELPTFSIKSINTFFFKFEIEKIEKLKELSSQDLEKQRKKEKVRLATAWVAAQPKNKTILTEALNAQIKSNLLVLAELMGGIVYEEIWDAQKIEYQSGVIEIDSQGRLSNDVDFLWSDLQYVVKTAYRESRECIEGGYLAFPITANSEQGIFFMFCREGKLDEADYLMLLSIWQILLNSVDLSENT